MTGRSSHDEPETAGRLNLGGASPLSGAAATALPAVTARSSLDSLGVLDLRLTPLNTRVYFSVRWLGGMVVRGRFEDLSGRLFLPPPGDAGSTVTVQICASSVRTGIGLRDRHLRGPMFLYAARHPEITFRGGPPVRRDTHVALPGTLTIRDTSRPEELRCSRAGDTIVAATTIHRRGYDVGAPAGLRRLDPLFSIIGDDVQVRIEVALGA